MSKADKITYSVTVLVLTAWALFMFDMLGSDWATEQVRSW